MIGEITVTIRRRGFFGTLIRVPKVFRQHYRTMRRSGEGRIVSAYAAWLLTSVLVKVK